MPRLAIKITRGRQRRATADGPRLDSSALGMPAGQDLPAPASSDRMPGPRMAHPAQLMPYIWSAISVAAAVIVSGALLAIFTPLPNLSMIFLVAVLFAAVRFGMRPAIFASLLSFLTYNFFFVEPVYTFRIAEVHELLALGIFLIVAITTSALAGRVRDQASVAAERM